MNKFIGMLLVVVLSGILGTALYPVAEEYIGWRLAPTEQKEFQIATADDKWNWCNAVFKSGIRKNEVVRIYDVTSERGGIMNKYRIDDHSNPTYLYADAFKEYSCG